MSVSGWCESKGRPDQGHAECAARLADGRLERCDCPAHEEQS